MSRQKVRFSVARQRFTVPLLRQRSHGTLAQIRRCELFCLDPSSGHIVWYNKLKGLGLGIVAFTGSTQSVAQAAAMAAQLAAT